MANQTIYDIRLRYLLDDKASKGVGKLADESARAGRASAGLAGILGKVGGLVIGTFGARAAGKALIGFNSDLEQAKITMAGMIQLNLGGSWGKNMQTANRLVGDFQQMAKASVGTTKDFVNMAQLITRPLTAAGGSMNDLKDATKGAVIASRAFGIDPEQASRDIESALQGTLTAKDRFARALLEPMGFDTAKFNQLDPTKRLDTLIKAFNSPAIKDMAKAQENSWAGVTSTLEDNLQMTVGKIGLPLFKALTEEVKSWNAWLDDNQDKVKELADDLAKGLVTGFGAVKDAISFLINHKDTLITLGKIWLAVKAGQAAGAIGGMFGGMGGLNARVGSNAAGGGGGALAAGAGAAMAGWEIGKRLNEESDLLGDTLADLNASWRVNLEAARKQERVNAEMDAFDSSIRNAKARMSKRGGMWSTETAGYMQGAADDLKNQANKAGDRERDKGYHMTKAGALLGPLGGSMLGSSGYSITGGYRNPFQDQLDAKAAGSQQNATLTATTASMVWVAALGKLNTTALQNLDQAKAQNDVMVMIQRTLVNNPALLSVPGYMDLMTAKALSLMGNDQLVGSDGVRGSGKAKKPSVKVTINRIEVQSDDPDRMAFGLVEAFRDAARNPSHAFDTLREG